MKNKTRKLLGRFAAALIIIALVLSMFSCAKVPTEDSAVVDSLKTDIDASFENTPETNEGQNARENTDNIPVDLDPVTVVNNDDFTKSEDTDSFAPAKLSIQDEFRPYEVVITLTKEETALDKYYTIGDFPELDIFHVFLQDEYYNKFDYPQYSGHRTLVALLNEPSKQRVLEYCDKLENDPRVAFARPNTLSFSDEVWIFPSKDLRQSFFKLSKDDFPKIKAQSIAYYDEFRHPCVMWRLECDTEDDLAVIDQIKTALASEKVDYVEPTYKPYGITKNTKYFSINDDYFTPDDNYQLKEWSEFPYGK